MAVSVIIGTKLLALSEEQSPINPLSWEPIGLKYRKETLFKSTLFSSFSQSCLLSPYGDSAFLNGADSLTGNTSGLPYTVHEDEKIICNAKKI